MVQVQVAVSLLLVTLASSWVLARPQESDEVNTSKIRIIVPDEHDDENGRALDSDKAFKVGHEQDHEGITDYSIIPSLQPFLSSSSVDGPYQGTTPYEDNFSTNPFLVKPLIENNPLKPSNILTNPKFVQKVSQLVSTEKTEMFDRHSTLPAHFAGLHSPTNKPWAPPVVFPTEVPTSTSNLPSSSMAALVSSIVQNDKITSLIVTPDAPAMITAPVKSLNTSLTMQNVSLEKCLAPTADPPTTQFQTSQLPTSTVPFISSSSAPVASSISSISSTMSSSSSPSSSTTSTVPLSSTMSLSSMMPSSSTMSSSSATLKPALLPSSSMQTFVILPSSPLLQNSNSTSSSFQSSSTTSLTSTVESQTSRMQSTIRETTPSAPCQPSGTSSSANRVSSTTADIVVISTTSRPTQSNRQRPRSTTKRPSLKSSLDACNRNCTRNNNRSICAKPVGDGEVDPESLKGFPSECHLNCNNNFKRQQYEKLIDGKCGRLRNRVRPLDADKLTRGELKKAQYQVNKEPQEVIEFTPL